jgi:glyoxylase-like metal-dependent hydrolase (beta-lactamase superfamily II)
MRKLLKLLLWTVAILASLIAVAALIFLLNFYKATRAMTPADTGKINDSVWCVRDRFVNAFIFKGRQSYIMIDAGLGAKKFKAELDKLGISPDNITTILLTHTDGDHTGSVPLYKNASIYMHRDEEQMVNGTMGKTKFSKTKWKYGPYKLLNDNDSLSIDGLKIRLIHTPGHTPGSVCYIIGNDYLVSGDNLTVTNGKYEHFVEKFNMNTPVQIESLKTLPPPKSFKYILTAHNGVIRVQP